MSDVILKSFGLFCAAGSVAFAAYMATHQSGGPRINAMEDFAIFAQPNRLRAVEAAVRAATLDARARKAHKPILIDMTPIGSTGAGPSQSAGEAPAGLRIADLSEKSALLEWRDGFRRVFVGDEAPALGRVISIRKLDDYWVVVGSSRSLAQAPSRLEDDTPPNP